MRGSPGGVVIAAYGTEAHAAVLRLVDGVESVHPEGSAVALGSIAGVWVTVVGPAPGAVEGLIERYGARLLLSFGLIAVVPPVRARDVVVPRRIVDAGVRAAAWAAGEDEWIPEDYAPVAHLLDERGGDPRVLEIRGAAGSDRVVRADAAGAAALFGRAVLAQLYGQRWFG
ncbi:hypothetical protein [Dactylosporangium sp. NPDC048998]|uniref:hypothetical protein n=1 Tax=Dactylosporangium sp. NPDC048998 TaxID=3363976 RepID=UPI003713D153